MASEFAEGSSITVKGHVTVDLIDPDAGGAGSWRGKVIERQEGTNFLSTMWEQRAKWEQRQIWGAMHPNRVGNVLGDPPQYMPVFPAEFLAAWNDGATENPATEISVDRPLVAWASRWPIGSASGKRGVVNITESELTESQAKWVFDWTTSQGNGTFQSIGWTRVDKDVNGGESILGRFPEDDFITIPISQVGNEGGLEWDGTVFHTIEAVSSGSSYRLSSFPASGGTATAGVTIPSSITQSAYYQVRGLAKSGSSWYICGSTSSSESGGSPTIALMTSAGVQTWRRTETLTGAYGYRDVTVDGSGNPWVVAGNGNMYRLSSADGTIAATVTPTCLGGVGLHGIAFDAADGNFWIHARPGIAKVDSSGTLVGPIWGYGFTQSSDTTSAPYVGTFSGAAVSRFDSYRRHYLTSQTSGNISDSLTTRAPNGWVQSNSLTLTWPNRFSLVVKDNFPYVMLTGGGSQGVSAIKGRNLASRMRLTSPVTKTSSNSLKITYTFTFS